MLVALLFWGCALGPAEGDCARDVQIESGLASVDSASYIPGVVSDGARIGVGDGMVTFDFLVHGAASDDLRSFDVRLWLAEERVEEDFTYWSNGRLIQDEGEACPTSDWPMMTQLEDAPPEGTEEPRELVFQLTMEGEEPVEWTYDVTLVSLVSSEYY